jgi:hypothetical protein
MKIYKLSKEIIPSGQKGECFANARNWAWDNDDGNTFVIHGKVTNTENKTFDHAWVENNDTVIDPTQGIKIDKKEYYKLVNAKPEAKYTPQQVLINTVKSNNCGPWTKEEVGNRFVSRID